MAFAVRKLRNFLLIYNRSIWKETDAKSMRKGTLFQKMFSHIQYVWESRSSNLYTDMAMNPIDCVPLEISFLISLNYEGRVRFFIVIMKAIYVYCNRCKIFHNWIISLFICFMWTAFLAIAFKSWKPINKYSIFSRHFVLYL